MACTRWLVMVLAVALFPGCFHWAPLHDLSDLEGVRRVRVEPADAPAYVLDHPTVEEVRSIAIEQKARIEIRKLNGWTTALGITGLVILTAAVVLFCVGLGAVGSLGGG